MAASDSKARAVAAAIPTAEAHAFENDPTLFERLGGETAVSYPQLRQTRLALYSPGAVEKRNT